MAYAWDFSVLIPYYPVLIKGLIVTFKITVLTIFFGTVFGFLVGIFLNQSKSIFRKIVQLLVDFFRSVPVIILILWFYFLIPELTGMKWLSAFALAVIALTSNLLSFIADVVRAAIDNMPKEHIDAARSLGLSTVQIWKHIILPEVVHNILPTLALLYLMAFKLSSLASIISVYELTHSADLVVMNTFRSLEVYTVVTIIYACIVLPFFYFARRMEKKYPGVIP